MAVVALPIDAGTEARTILHHLLERGDVAGPDATGRTVITLTVDDLRLAAGAIVDVSMPAPRTSRMVAMVSRTTSRKLMGRFAEGVYETAGPLVFRASF